MVIMPKGSTIKSNNDNTSNQTQAQASVQS